MDQSQSERDSDQIKIQQAVVVDEQDNQLGVQQSKESEMLLKDRARGCMIGACMGDAAGSVLQFMKGHISVAAVKNAITFPGGGALAMKRAQITDDGELTLCLARGLINGKGKMDLVYILEQYGKWLKSPPFDIGNTTYAAFSAIFAKGKVVENVLSQVKARNKWSESNGCLMRATPIGIWGHKLSDVDIISAGGYDASLTHCSQVPLVAVGLYCLAIKYLLHGTSKKATYEIVKQAAKGTYLEQWFTDIIENDLVELEVPAMEKIGWLKIAFCYGMDYLKKEKDYKQAMEDMLLKGGDTDTNACIIGGLLGASCGYSKLPEDMKKNFFMDERVEVLMKSDRLLSGEYIAQISALKYVDDLLEIAPTKLEVVTEH